MRCFYHGESEAVAICKSCGHGLCHDCCAEVGTSAACRNRCETDVQALNDIIQRNRTAYQKTGAIYLWFSIGFSVFGLWYLGSAILTLQTERPDYGGIVAGCFFLGMGIVFFVGGRRFRAK